VRTTERPAEWKKLADERSVLEKTAPQEFKGSHWDEPNVLVHRRTNEREVNGVPSLHMEEIQSDWNQQLRAAYLEVERRGLPFIVNDPAFKWPEDLSAPPENPYFNNWVQLAIRSMLIVAAELGLDGVSWLPGDLHVMRFPRANRSSLLTFYDVIVCRAMAKLARSCTIKLRSYDIIYGINGSKTGTSVFGAPLSEELRLYLTLNGLPYLGAIATIQK
jgi:hypothetical protein